MKVSQQKRGWGCREFREGRRRGHWGGHGGLGLLVDWRGVDTIFLPSLSSPCPMNIYYFWVLSEYFSAATPAGG